MYITEHMATLCNKCDNKICAGVGSQCVLSLEVVGSEDIVSSVCATDRLQMISLLLMMFLYLVALQ